MTGWNNSLKFVPPKWNLRYATGWRERGELTEKDNLTRARWDQSEIERWDDVVKRRGLSLKSRWSRAFMVMAWAALNFKVETRVHIGVIWRRKTKKRRVQIRLLLTFVRVYKLYLLLKLYIYVLRIHSYICIGASVQSERADIIHVSSLV